MSRLAVPTVNGRIAGWTPPQDGGAGANLVDLPFAPIARSPIAPSFFTPSWTSPNLLGLSPSPSPAYTSPSSRSPSLSPSAYSPLSTSSASSSGESSKRPVPKNSTERRFKKQRDQNPNYAPRPKNAFILFRIHFVEQNKGRGAELSGGHIKTLSKLASEAWTDLSEDDKDVWRNLQKKALAEHNRRYPDYRYQPKRKTQRSKSNTASPVPQDSQAVPVMLRSASTSALESPPYRHEGSPTSTSSAPGTPTNDYETTYPEVSDYTSDAHSLTLREYQLTQGGVSSANYGFSGEGYITKPVNATAPLFKYSTFDDDLDDSNIVSLTSSRKSSFAGPGQEASPSTHSMTSHRTPLLSEMIFEPNSMPSTEIANVPSLTLTSFDEPLFVNTDIDGAFSFPVGQPSMDFGIDPRQLDLGLHSSLTETVSAPLDLEQPFQISFDGDISNFELDISDLFML